MKVFVYGTLKQGERFHNNYMKGRVFFVENDTVAGSLFDLGPYPAAVEEKLEGASGRIHGEVYEIGSITLQQLDQLEGHPVYYSRRYVKTAGGHGVWVYYMPQEVLNQMRRKRLMANGHWGKSTIGEEQAA